VENSLTLPSYYSNGIAAKVLVILQASTEIDRLDIWPEITVHWPRPILSAHTCSDGKIAVLHWEFPPLQSIFVFI